MRKLGFVTIMLVANGAFAQAHFSVGSTVLASPNQMDSSWKRCVVRQLPSGYKGYELECADDYRGTSGMVRTLNTVSVPPRWVKADDPAFRRDMQIPAIRAEIAKGKAGSAKAAQAAKAPRKPDGAAGTVALGSYECWAHGSARMLLNFKVTSAGQYIASDGSRSTFSHDPATGRIVFKGYLAESLPNGFTTKYYEPKGRPTVSFRSAGGSEASFCERR